MERTAEMILGVIGGIFGALAGIFAIFVGITGDAFGISNHCIFLGLGAIILGVLGIVGGVLVNKNNKLSAGLMIFSGIFGFICVSIFWTIAGLLLIIGGILAYRD